MSSISTVSSASRSPFVSVLFAFSTPAARICSACHCSPSLLSGTVAVFLRPERDEFLIFRIIEPEAVAHRADEPHGGIADCARHRQIDDLRQQLHLLGQAILSRLRQESVVVVAGHRHETGVGAGLADLRDVGREILGPDRREHRADKVLLRRFHLGLEDGDAVAPPGVVHPDRVEILEFGAAQKQRHRARTHRRRMLARKKFGTKDSAVRRPSPLSEETKIAFHSSSFGTTARASEERVIPVKMLQPSRSTISCALRTASAGLPPVSSSSNLISRPSRPPFEFCVLIHSSQPRFSC